MQTTYCFVLIGYRFVKDEDIFSKIDGEWKMKMMILLWECSITIGDRYKIIKVTKLFIVNMLGI